MPLSRTPFREWLLHLTGEARPQRRGPLSPTAQSKSIARLGTARKEGLAQDADSGPFATIPAHQILKLDLSKS